MMKLRGINISVVKMGNNQMVMDLPEEETQKENVPKKIEDFLKTKNIDFSKFTAKTINDLEEENQVEIGGGDSDADLSEEEEEWEEKNLKKKNIGETNYEKPGGEKKLPSKTVTLKELDGQEVEEEDFNPFWFCGPPSAVPRVDGQKPAKMWRGEEGQDCGDCFNNWVHHCLQDIPVS